MAYSFVCAECSTPFTHPDKKLRYCSKKCFFEYERKRTRIERTCEWCKKTYQSLVNRNIRFCSRKCWLEDHAHKPRRATCEVCGSSFFQPQGNERKTCSKECASKATGAKIANQVARVCQVCGKPFTSVPSHEAKFCSRSCSDKGRYVGKKMSENVKYYGPNWKRQRQRAVERDNHQCQHCRKTEKAIGRSIHVHHIKPLREFTGDYEQGNHLTNLICLCPQCHSLAESGCIPIQPYLV